MRKGLFRLRRLFVIAVLSTGAHQAQAAASGYVFNILDTLGGQSSLASAINNAGQVVGSATAADGSSHATLWQGATVTALSTLAGGDYTIAAGISESGLITGSTMVNGDGHVLTWHGGTLTDLTAVSGVQGYAVGINNAAQVVGALSAGFGPHAGIWTGGVATNLDPSSSSGTATGINPSGQVAGYSDQTGQRRATVWQGTQTTTLGTLGGSDAYAMAINDAGQVTGASTNTGDLNYHAALWNGTVATDLGGLSVNGDSEGSAINAPGQVVGYATLTLAGSPPIAHATLWEDGAIIDLNTLLDASASGEWLLTGATDINDAGVIIGQAINLTTHATRSFTLTPVPEPSLLAMLLGGLGVLAWRAKALPQPGRAQTQY